MEILSNADAILTDISIDTSENTIHKKFRFGHCLKRLILLMILIMCALELLLFFVIDFAQYREMDILKMNITEKIQELFKKL